ncbi:MAG: hypothetical protein HY608_05905 [Planctomycetes bacterium]|nr:hypothetical protein [Planctomycetota bacterium]
MSDPSSVQRPASGGVRAVAELTAVAATYAAWLVGEHLKMKGQFLGVALSVWVAYFVLRSRRESGLWRAWGFRADNLASSARFHLVLGGALVAFLAAVGWARGTLTIDRGVLVVLAIYPFWALAQQFFLQNAVVRNILDLGLGRRWAVALAAVCFSVAHAPDLPLMGLTAVAGGAWTMVFLRHPNLWMLSLTHACVGTLAFCWALGRDPLAEFPQLLMLLG